MGTNGKSAAGLRKENTVTVSGTLGLDEEAYGLQFSD